MSQFPDPPNPYSDPSMYSPAQPHPGAWSPVPQVRTSGLAIASIVLGSIGLFTCCFIVPSLMAIIFAAVALPAIGRGEVKGRGLAVAGLVLGILGLLMGIAIWVFGALAPDTNVVTGDKLSTRNRTKLEKLGAVENGEEVVAFHSDGTFSLEEGGAVITATKLVIYTQGSAPQKARLADIKSLSFTPGDWVNDGRFVATLDDGKLITFSISGFGSADRRFNELLEKAVTAARKSVGKNVTLTDDAAEAEEEDEAEDPPAPKPPPPPVGPRANRLPRP